MEPRASRPNLPGYGIVAENEGEGLLPWSWARERLASARNYFLATTSPEGRPHLMVVWGLFLDDQFLFSTSRESRKGRNLAQNPRCSVAPDGAEEAVLLEGVASDLADPSLRERWVREYKSKYDIDVSGMSEGVFVVRPERVFGQIEKTFTKSATRWTFSGV
jgi:pyridoxine/pyridoxamine 5'-phosphate oxidase